MAPPQNFFMPFHAQTCLQWNSCTCLMNAVQHFSPSSDRGQKVSLGNILNETSNGFVNSLVYQTASPEDLIFNMFKIPNKNEASIGKLIMVLKSFGLLESDPRLLPMMKHIWEIERVKEEKTREARDPKHWKLKRDDFVKCISESISLISQTLQNDLVIPSWNSFTMSIKNIYENCKAKEEGKVADYIPQLARFDPNLWGVSICSIDGQRCSFGDTKVPFCVQSVSKAFNYAIASTDLGSEYVHGFIGQEPSGRLYNEICLDGNNKPHSPLINSGAIITTSLIQSKMNLADRFDYMINKYREISGGEYVGFNNAVFLSERSTADRNMALAYFMQENNCFPKETTDLMKALDFYFMLCSLEVTAESASVMAATLANGGVCPITGKRCIGSRPIRDLLSLMSSCGMYDGSGQFAFHVGLPAKSGVSGIMIVIVPNVMGIAMWSPPLNKQGNSVRGLAFCHELIQSFNFHTFDTLLNNESIKIDPRKHACDRQREQIVSLLFAAKVGDLNTIRRMYMQRVNLEYIDYDKRTALHLAASEGHAHVIMFLLNVARVNPNPKDRWKRTPLDDAKAENHIDCVQLLEYAVTSVEHHNGPNESNKLVIQSEDEDSGAVLTNSSKTSAKTKGSIETNQSSDRLENTEEPEEFEIEKTNCQQRSMKAQKSQDYKSGFTRKNRQGSMLQCRSRSYSANQITDLSRRTFDHVSNFQLRSSPSRFDSSR